MEFLKSQSLMLKFSMKLPLCFQWIRTLKSKSQINQPHQKLLKKEDGNQFLMSLLNSLLTAAIKSMEEIFKYNFGIQIKLLTH
jgi:hypothetical protein